jgi:hypothetical protein
MHEPVLLQKPVTGPISYLLILFHLPDLKTALKNACLEKPVEIYRSGIKNLSASLFLVERLPKPADKAVPFKKP